MSRLSGSCARPNPRPKASPGARELASHFRWRLRVADPRVYGDKVDVNHGGAVAVTAVPFDMARLSAEQRETVRDVLLKFQPRVAGPD
jgi:hypothetical protein